MNLILSGQDFAETLHAYVLPFSAVVLCLYPPILFLRMLTAGLARTEQNDFHPVPDREFPNSTDRAGACTTFAAIAALAPLLLAFPGGCGFSVGPAVPQQRDVTDLLLVGIASNVDSHSSQKSMSSSVCESMGCLMGVGMVSIAMRSLFQTVARARGQRAERRKLGKAKLIRNPSGILRRCSAREREEVSGEARSHDYARLVRDVPVWEEPPATATSHWHHTDLFVQDWLDEAWVFF